MFYGDFLPGQRVNIAWSTNSRQGASISRSVPGTIVVIRGSTSAQSSVGVTDTRDILGAVGVDTCAIDTSNPFYQPYDDYMVILVSATVDGQSVNAVLGEFSILNRSHSRLMVAGTVDYTNFTATATEFELGDVTTEADDSNLAGRAVYGSIGNTLIKQVGVIESSDIVGGKAHIVMPAGAPMTAAFPNGSRILIA
jgi:hypothetical protein